MDNAWVARGFTSRPTVDFDFVPNLSKDAFKVFRYIHEGRPPDEGGWLAHEIGVCARRVILERHPEWEGLGLQLPGRPRRIDTNRR